MAQMHAMMLTTSLGQSRSEKKSDEEQMATEASFQSPSVKEAENWETFIVAHVAAFCFWHWTESSCPGASILPVLARFSCLDLISCIHGGALLVFIGFGRSFRPF